MQLCVAFLLFLAVIFHGKSPNIPKNDPKQMDVTIKDDPARQGNLCPENKTKHKPRSCVDHLKNGANRCGFYKIYDAAGNGFTVYCDMKTEPGALPLKVNDPVNENSPNWSLYRLTADRMKSLREVSTHWRATCSFDKYGINHYTDYVRGKLAEADIFAFLAFKGR